jgi:hypothetical protein
MIKVVRVTDHSHEADVATVQEAKVNESLLTDQLQGS